MCIVVVSDRHVGRFFGRFWHPLLLPTPKKKTECSNNNTKRDLTPLYTDRIIPGGQTVNLR
jgi:hypothetical protein